MNWRVRRPEAVVIVLSGSVILLALITAMSAGAPDQKVATVAGFVALFVPLLFRLVYRCPSRRAWPWVSPFYNDGIYALFAVFMAAHVSFLEVPFFHLDLYNTTWGYADVPSHFLGGMVTWLIFTFVVFQASITYGRNWSAGKIVAIGTFALLLVGLGWELFEVALIPQMPWLYESFPNKVQDVVMEVLGVLTGVLMVTLVGYPYRIEGAQREEAPMK